MKNLYIDIEQKGEIPPYVPPDIDWVRSTEWPALPTLVEGDQKVVGLYAVYDKYEFVSIKCSGDYTVDWGDGVVENVSSGTKKDHTFNYDALVGTDTSRGYRVAIVTITPNGGNLTSVDLMQEFTLTGLQVRVKQWLDIKVAGQYIDTLIISNSDASAASVYLESFEYVGTNLITNFNYFFINCTSLQNIPQFNTNNGTAFAYMFQNCSSLQSCPFIDCSNATTVSGMFLGAMSLKTIPITSIGSATILSNTFQNCTKVTELPIFDTHNVNSFTHFADGCSSIKTIPLYDTSSGASFQYMVANCVSLETIPLIDIGNGTAFDNMFDGCNSLISIPLINTSKMVSSTYMFRNCILLKTIPLIDTSNCTLMQYMFYGCNNLKYIPLLNTSSTTSVAYMFYGCSNLNIVPNLDLSNCKDTSYMFYSCTNFDTVASFSIPKANRINSMFARCKNLKKISFINNAGSMTDYSSLYDICSCLESFTIQNPISGMNFLSINLASLRRLSLPGYNYNLNVSACNLSREALVELFTGLATATRTITVTNNFGSAALTADDKLIATSKGWTIVL